MKRLFVPQYADFLKERLLYFFSGAASVLDEKQLYGVLLTSAYSTHNKMVISNIVDIANDFVDESTINKAKSAAALAAAKFDHESLPCLESDINISGFEQCNRTFHAPDTQAPESNTRRIDDTDFLLFLLAASFISNFDNYMKMLVEQKSISMSAIKIVIPIAATVQSIAEKT